MRTSLILLLLASGVLHSQGTPSKALLVLSKGDTTLAIVDPATLKVIARMPSGPDPHEVVASSDGKFAYISNYGGGRYNSITPIDLIGQKALPAIDLGPLRGPHGLHFAGGKVWFTAEAAKAIGSYDPASRKIDWILGTGQNGTHMIFVSEDLTRLFTTNIASGTVTIVDKAGNGWEETVIPVGQRGEGFDVTPDGKELWVANAGDGTVSILDAVNKKAVQTLQAGVSGANRLKFTPDGKLALISTLRGPDVTLIDTAKRTVVKRVKVGTGAAGIQMQPDGARAFIACTPDNSVVILDLKSLAVTGQFDAGKQPDGMAWATQRQ
jgi:Uncharacterized conserved protein